MCYNRQSWVVRALVTIASFALFKVKSQLERFEINFQALWLQEKKHKQEYPNDNQQQAVQFFKSQVGLTAFLHLLSMQVYCTSSRLQGDSIFVKYDFLVVDVKF